jgi:hypothetical protein
MPFYRACAKRRGRRCHIKVACWPTCPALMYWYYIGSGPVAGYESGYLGTALMGGPMLKDITQTRKMLNGGKLPFIDELSQKLLNIDCDGYWIVSHNEGLRIAIELSASKPSGPYI